MANEAVAEERNLRKFKLKSAKAISEMALKFMEGDEVFIEESDLSLQDDKYLLQFELQKVDEEPPRTKYTIRPGTYNIAQGMQGLYLAPLDLKQTKILEISEHSSRIIGEFKKFFGKLDMYKKYGVDPKRAILLHGDQGCGKTSSITTACNQLIEEDKGTVIITWNAASIRSSDVLDFFTSGTEYHESCTRLVPIIEDIGMSVEGYGGPKEVDRSLLNYLDGSAIAFQIPTFIVATTNYAQNLPANLVDRPGRFDEVIKIGFPNGEDRVKIMEFIMKEELSEDDKKVIAGKDCDEFSPAHLKEIFIRSKLNGVGMEEIVKQLKEHKKSYGKGFEDRNPAGFGLR